MIYSFPHNERNENKALKPSSAIQKTSQGASFDECTKAFWDIGQPLSDCNRMGVIVGKRVSESLLRFFAFNQLISFSSHIRRACVTCRDGTGLGIYGPIIITSQTVCFQVRQRATIL